MNDAIAGWASNDCRLSMAAHSGRQKVLLSTADVNGRFSDVYQVIKTIPGVTYTLEYDVWADASTASSQQHCDGGVGNGLLLITAGAVQLSCRNVNTRPQGNSGQGYCAGGEHVLCPAVHSGWDTVSGTYIATANETTFRLHVERNRRAYFDQVRIMGPCPSKTRNLLVNGGLLGPVVDNTIVGWKSHNCNISVVDWAGRHMVLWNRGMGTFSDVYQTITTVKGQQYRIRFDVWARMLANKVHKKYCTSTDSNGLMAITNAAIQMGCSPAGGYCAHGEAQLCPRVAGRWTTVVVRQAFPSCVRSILTEICLCHAYSCHEILSGDARGQGVYTAAGAETTLRLHSEEHHSACVTTLAASVATRCTACRHFPLSVVRAPPIPTVGKAQRRTVVRATSVARLAGWLTSGWAFSATGMVGTLMLCPSRLCLPPERTTLDLSALAQ